MAGEGGGVVGAHVPDHLKTKIWLDKYIVFSDLLPNNTHDDNTYSMTLNDTGSTPTLLFAPRKITPIV